MTYKVTIPEALPLKEAAELLTALADQYRDEPPRFGAGTGQRRTYWLVVEGEGFAVEERKSYS